MTGSSRLGKGARREAGSEGSQCRNFGLDAQKPDKAERCRVTGQWTRMPNSHSETSLSKSGEARRKETKLNLGGLSPCLDETNFALVAGLLGR